MSQQINNPFKKNTQELLKYLSSDSLVNLFTNLTKSWHNVKPGAPQKSISIEDFIQSLHYYNFSLWHKEDQARRTDVDDSVIANTKRAIDTLNQQRNDSIENIDSWIAEQLQNSGIQAGAEAELNSETPGSIIDRLSILSLKEYHMDEQANRTDVSQEHTLRASERTKILKEQRRDLANCLDKFIVDLATGHKRLKIYFQFKLYNDPSTNPAVYMSEKMTKIDT